MLAVMLMLAAAPQAAAPSLLATAQGKLSVAAAAEPERADRRYRIDSEAVVDDRKERALGTTGGQCQVVGARMCTKTPRTWLKAPIGP